jgi:hypothetical protein
MKILNRLSMMLSAAVALALLAVMILSYPAKSAEAALLTSNGDVIAAHKTVLLPTNSVIGDTPVPAPNAGSANLLATDNILSLESVDPAGAMVLSPRQRVFAALEREDIRQGLRNYGVSPEEARARVASLTDSEVAELANELDNTPAGAGYSHSNHGGGHHGSYVHDSTFPKLLVIGTAAVLFPPSLIFFGFIELLSYASHGHSWDQER